MSQLNKACAAIVIAFVTLVGVTPYAIDSAFNTHLVQTLNKAK